MSNQGKIVSGDEPAGLIALSSTIESMTSALLARGVDPSLLATVTAETIVQYMKDREDAAAEMRQAQISGDRLMAVREIGLSVLSAIDRASKVVRDGQGERTLDAIARANAERVSDEVIDSTLRGELGIYAKLVAVADRAALLAAEIEASLLPEGWVVNETISSRIYSFQGGNAQVTIDKEFDRGAMTIRVWGERTWAGYAGDAPSYVPLAAALTRAQETLADPSSHLSPYGVEKVEAAKNKLDAERAEVVSVMRESAREWRETADRYKNALLGERFIVLDRRERAVRLFRDDEDIKIKIELPDASLNGVSFMTKVDAEKTCTYLEMMFANEDEQFAVWDFQQYAQQQAAKSADLALKIAESKWAYGREAKNLHEGKELAEVAMARLGLPQPESWFESGSQGTLASWEYTDLDVGGYKKLTVGVSAGGVLSIERDPHTPSDRNLNVTLANVERSLVGALEMLGSGKTQDEPMESLSGAVMRLDRRSGMVEVLIDEEIISFGGAPAIKRWVEERGISNDDAQRLYELDAQGSRRSEIAVLDETKVALDELPLSGSSASNESTPNGF